MQRFVKSKFTVLAGAAAVVAVVTAGAVLSSTRAHAAPVAQLRCAADALNPATSRLRVEWARQCATRINVVSPTSPVPPASKQDTGVVSGDGVTHLIEYFENNDFFGKNSYTGVDGGVNQIFMDHLWRAGVSVITVTTDANGFQKWTKPAAQLLSRPIYPTFGNNANIDTAVQLFPNPNYALNDCNLYLDPQGTRRADTSATGFFVNAFCVPEDIGGRCADGTTEQIFSGGMAGCAGAVTFANRDTLCAPGSRTVSAAEWTTLRGGIVPTHDYWTNNNLKYNGTGPSACFVSAETGNSCGATPMRVCTAAGTDAEGNQCNWQHCGLNANTPDQFFGGCVGNTTAGALCIVGGCADSSIEQTFAGGMVGCASVETYANRAAACGPGYRVATAAEWVALRNGIAPTHNYWTNDPLKYNGTGPSACFVSTSVGNDCGATPMRVCTGTDPEGNTCNWTHCGIDANTPDQFFGGCVGNTTAGVLCVPNMGCADGSVEQVFANGMVGCAGSVTFANRDTLCAPGFQPATAAQWAASRGAAVPTHDYWTDDALKWSGSGPSACFVSTSVGNDSCGASPMRVCTAAGTDAEGNSCNWTHCGLNANSPDQFFGGCLGNAGTVCMPSP